MDEKSFLRIDSGDHVVRNLEETFHLLRLDYGIEFSQKVFVLWWLQKHDEDKGNRLGFNFDTCIE